MGARSVRVGPRRRGGLLATALAGLALLAVPAAGQASFVQSWDAGVYEKKSPMTLTDQWARTGAFAPLAGAHPFRAETHFQLKESGGIPLEYARDVTIETPPGLVVNPEAVPKCTRGQMIWNGCPPESQVGVAFAVGGLTGTEPVYNLVPRKGVAAEFGFVVTQNGLVLVSGDVTADGRIRAVVTKTSETIALRAVHFGFFGVPYDPDNRQGASTPVITAPAKALVSTPTSCVGPVDTLLDINSWQNPLNVERWVSTTPVGGTGCDELDFPARGTVTTSSSRAGAPTGLTFAAEVPQTDDPKRRVPAHVKRIEVAFPEGMTVNPAASDGLDGCSPAQVNLKSTDPVKCPAGSKIGSVEIKTPLLAEPVGGSVYLATPHQNPFDSLVALYVVAENAERGIRLKIPGRVDLDQQTGRMTATFDDNPQLPFDRLEVRLNGGDRAPISMPKTCGEHDVTVTFSPWSAADPDNPTPAEQVVSTSKLRVSEGCQPQAFTPGFAAGSVDASAGVSSPFTATVARSEGQPYLKTIRSVTLPEGLLGNIGAVPLCGDADAAAGTCPESSRVGRVEVSAGAGGYPVWVPQAGKTPTGVYLTGGYKGAPYGLSIKVPAQAGPFDLGTVVVRGAIHVDRKDAHVTVQTDDMPTILQGIPLQVRDVRVAMDRPGFMRNPTSCVEKQVAADLRAVDGSAWTPAARYQAARCKDLDLGPKLDIAFTDGKEMKKGRHPGVEATLRQASGQSNLREVKVALPLAVALDPDNAKALCEPDGPAKLSCPEDSIIGHARATTPLLKGPISGPVYFVKGTRTTATGRVVATLPKLWIPLSGEGINLDLHADSDAVGPAGKQKLVSTFTNVPDAPVDSFTLKINSGKNGILKATANVCAAGRGTEATYSGQNGRVTKVDVAGSASSCRPQIASTKTTRASVSVRVAGIKGGRLTVSGKRVRKTARTVKSADVATVKAKLKLTSGQRRTLKRGRSVKVAVRVAYKPKQGKTVTLKRTVTVKGTKKKAKR